MKLHNHCINEPCNLHKTLIDPNLFTNYMPHNYICFHLPNQPLFFLIDLLIWEDVNDFNELGLITFSNPIDFLTDVFYYKLRINQTDMVNKTKTMPHLRQLFCKHHIYKQMNSHYSFSFYQLYYFFYKDGHVPYVFFKMNSSSNKEFHKYYHFVNLITFHSSFSALMHRLHLAKAW